MNENDIFEYNLKELEIRFPYVREKLDKINEEESKEQDFEIIGVPGNFPNLILATKDGQSIFFHNIENPIKEASDIINSIDFKKNIDAFFVMGFGAGYHIEVLMDKLHKEIPIIIIEKSIKIFRETLKLKRYDKIWNRNRLWLSLDESAYDSTFYALANFYNISPRPGFQILSVRNFKYFVHNLYFALFKDYYNEAVQEINKIAEAAGDNAETFRQFIDLWGDNIVENCKRFLFNPGVVKLKDVFKDIPAVIVGAGPSLDKNIRVLKEYKDKVLILSVDTALKTFKTNGFEPHFVLSVDGQKMNYKHYENVELDKTFLVSDPVSYPEILRKFENRMFTCTCGHPLNFYLEELTEIKGFLSGSGSVATNCITLALYMGCDPIIFIGLDLSYSGWQTHTRVSAYQEMYLERIDKFNSVVNMVIGFKISQRETTVKGNYEEIVPTSKTMKRWIEWIEKAIKEVKARHFVNATEGGAFIQGTEIMTLSEAAKKYLKDINISIIDVIEKIYKEESKRPDRKFLTTLQETIMKLQEIVKLTRKAREIINRKALNPKEKRDREIQINRIARQIIGNKLFMRLSQWDVEPLIAELMEKQDGLQSGGFNEEAFFKIFKGVKEVAEKLITRLNLIYEKTENHIS
ncbi:MAG: 6-hydroxymethylpterin diphosphokinase MptE-like protein [Candidatus Hydrogenedentota bacterium]